MKLAIFNGSPRGKNSNTTILLNHFQKGFADNGGQVTTYDYLINEKQLKKHVWDFRSAEAILLAFPLYIDSMPSIVKAFIEEIGNYDGVGKKVLFLVQSGFPESVHSTYVKKYLELLADRWGMENLGVIIKPGVEGLKMKPESWNKKVYQGMKRFGTILALDKSLDERLLKKFANPFRFTKFRITIFNMLKYTGLVNYYWDFNLKKNNAFGNRFDMPYLTGVQYNVEPPQ